MFSLILTSFSQGVLFSVVIPAYNAQSTLRRAVNSVLNQTCQDLEVVIVDDGSRDKTAKIAAEMEDGNPKVRVVQVERSHGLLSARVGGVRWARGEFIVHLDADDELSSNVILAQIRDVLAQKPFLDVVHFKTLVKHLGGDYVAHPSNPVRGGETVSVPIAMIHNSVEPLITGKAIQRDVMVSAYDMIGEILLEQNIVYLEHYIQNAAVLALAKKYYSLAEIGQIKHDSANQFSKKPYKEFRWAKKLVMDSIAIAKRFYQIFVDYRLDAQLMFEQKIRPIFEEPGHLTVGQLQELCQIVLRANILIEPAVFREDYCMFK